MFGKKSNDNGEKLYRYSIRKYHFGAASVAVAALMFFANGGGVAAAELVTPATAKPNAHQLETTMNSGGDSSGTSGRPENTKEINKPAEVSTQASVTPDRQVEKETGNSTLLNDVNQDALENKVINTSSVNITDLQTALIELESKLTNVKGDEEKEKFNTVIVEAKKLLGDKEATQEQVNQQLTLVKGTISSVEALLKKQESKVSEEETKKSEKDRSAEVEASNSETAIPARSARGRKGRTTEVQPVDSENATPTVGAATSNKVTESKELPTYTNGTDNYALAEEMRKIVKYLQDNGADAAKVAAIKGNYDKLNEKLGLVDENGVLSEEDFNKALANLKQARDFTEGFLNNQPSLQLEAVLPANRHERAADDRVRDSRFPNAYTTPYATAKEFYYEDGQKGSSPYDKYTYLFHTFTESLVANNRTHSPVRDVKRLVYEEVNEVKGGYLWTITFNAAHEDQHDGYAFFSIPKGQVVDNSSITIERTPQVGVAEEVAGTGDLGSRVRNNLFHGTQIGIRTDGANENSLEGLARTNGSPGYYNRRLEGDAGETAKSDDMFEKIADNTAAVYRFQLHGRDKYTISFKTTNTNNTQMDKLYYAAGYRVQQWGRRILAQQWHGRHKYDRSDTDNYPLHVVGNGTFLINQGKHYNTAYPQGAYGFGGHDFDYAPFKADGILGFDDSGRYNSNFDMHQYTARPGSDQPSSSYRANAAGQTFEFYDKEGNKLSASQIGMHGADKPGLVEYKVKRKFNDGSADFLNIKFAIKPKTPVFTENLTNSRGQTKNLTVSNGTNGYPITLFREYVENGVKKTEKVATVNANSSGNAVFNGVQIKSGKYYAQSIIPTSAYLDYKNVKHTDVRSDMSASTTVVGDGMAPTIQVGENGKTLATTPANNQVTLFVTPSTDGKVSLKVQMQDDNLGDGMDAFAKGTNANYAINGTYNSRATTYTADGGVTGANGKRDTIKGDLKIQLNQDGGKYKIPTGGLTVTLNAKDKAGNWTNTANPSKTLTVKVLSAVPNEPPVRMLTGNDVQNGAVKQSVKDEVLRKVKELNPDLVNNGVKFEYDTTVGRTNQIKVIYPDGQMTTIDPMKGTKPTKPLVVGPQDGTVSITPQGDTDKVTFQYVPTNETNPKTIIAKKDGNSWGIQGTRPNGITVDSSTGKITITEPTVKDLSNVTATATFLNSDTSDTNQDTAKNPDRDAPTVMMNGRALTERASDNRFVIFRGATFNPTFKVADNSGTVSTFKISGVPEGVWFNKEGNRDNAKTNLPSGTTYQLTKDNVVATTANLGIQEATVSVSDANGNTKNYKFQYTIADVVLKNSPKTVVPNTPQGDPHNFLATTVNGTTVDNDLYFPAHMQFQWVNGGENTPLTTVGTVQKEAKVLFPTNAQNGTTTANGMTIYAPAEIRKTVTFNVKDSAKPQATINGISLGTTSTTPIFTVIRGATFNPELKVWDDSGIIQDINIQNLPRGMAGTNYAGGRQTNRNSEANAYSERLASGTVSDTQTLGEHEATIRVTGSGSTDVSTFKFKYRVIDLELKNTYRTEDADKPIIGLSNNQSIEVTGGTNNISAVDYWKVVDTETKEDRGKAYLPEGITYELERPGGSRGISSNPADASKGATVRMGHYTGKIKVNFTTASDINDNNSKTRTVFAPATIEKPVYYAITPSAPTLKKAVDGTAERTTAGELLYGQAGNKPRIEVSNVVPKGDGAGNVNRDSTRFVRLYSSKDPNTFLAEKEVAGNSTSVIFEPSDYGAKRPNGLEEGEELYAVTRVKHGISTLSGASASELVTGRLEITENSSNRIIQANDQTLNDAEKTGIRIALRNANPRLNLSDDDIKISDTGEIVITKDKKRAWLQTAPNKDNGAGFVTRFANIRNDYKFENIEGLKVPGRDTDKGFAWSNDPSDNRVNSNRSLIYYYDATKGQSFNFNDVLKVLNLREGWSVNHTENPSFVATQGVNKGKAERREDGFGMSGTAFLKDGDYINVLDLVDKDRLRGGQPVSNSANKLVENGKANGTGTTLQNVTIGEVNGLPGFTLNNVVNGERAIHKAQVYLRPKYVNGQSLAERNNENQNTTTNVVNLYFVPIDSTKPVVERSDSNNLGTSADDAPRLTDTSITASSLVKVTDNYDKDDVTDSNTNSVRNKLNVWVKKDGVETQVVRNGQELTNPNGETVLGSLIKTVDPASYELIAKTADTSGNETEKQSLGFFKVGYNLNVRPVINFIQYEKLTDDDKRTLVRVNEGGQLEELPNGATVDVTFDTENLNLDYQDRRATATITFANGATTTKEIPYRVYRSFPLVNKLYDFAGVHLKPNWFYDPDYYKNEGLTGGMNWFIKKETEENGRKVFKDVPPKANSGEHVMPREINKSIDAGAGEYKYLLGATYPTGRYVARATDELSKLRREGEIVHTVFDVGANDTNKVTVNSGDSLTSDQARAAVMLINGSKELPEGTTYAWVSGLTVTGRGGDEVDREVRVTLPASGPANGPFAATQTKTKTVKVKVKIKPTKPTVTPDNNGDVRIGYNTNETNVNKVEVTYTPTDTNRLEDNGNVTKTPQERTTVIATKGTDNQWRITSGEKEGISVNSTTGEITLKDQVVKDQTKIQAKVVAQEVSSDENDSNNSKDGDREIPTIGLNNTLVEVGKEFSLPLGLSDGAGVGVDDTNIKVSLPNGETGLTYDATTKSIKGTISTVAKKDITVRVLDKNGNKAEKIISIAAVKAKPIYAIKDETIDNVDTPSNFVEMPAGLSASWKDNSIPTTTEVGNTNKTVTVSANGYAAINVDIPVTIYPKVTYRKVGGNEVTEYHEIVGQPLTSSVWRTGGRTRTVTADFYVEFEGGNKPEGTTITFKDGNPASPSTTAGITTKTIVVTYPNGAGRIEKNVTFKTYGNEAKYETGKDTIETTVGTEFSKITAAGTIKLSDPKLLNPGRIIIGWWKNNQNYTPENKIGKRNENVNVYFGEAVRNARGDGTANYNDQNITVNLTVKPQAPIIAEDALYGKGATKPNVTVGNLPTNSQLETGASVTVELFQGNKKVASKTVNGGISSVEFNNNDYSDNLTYSEKVHAVVRVAGGTGTTAYNLSSANSNSIQVTPQKPTFDTATVTSTSRTLSGTLGGFDATNRVVKVHLNDENNTTLSSENNGGVTINGNIWTATLPATVKLRQSVAKNGETTTPPAITVENTVTEGTVSTRSDNKAVEMGDYSVNTTIAGSKHVDVTVPHDAKRLELRFHNSEESGNKTNSIVLVRGTDGTWHTDATRADNTAVTNANGYVGRINSTVSTTNPAENNIRIALNEQSGTTKLHIKEENASGDNTESYGSGLGLRVYNQPEAGQEPSATGKWKVVGVTNTAPVLSHKGTDASSETNRKVYDSGTTITKEMLAELVTVTDPEDNAADANNKPYGSTTLEIVSGLTETPGQATPPGNYTVTLKATDSQGRKSNTLTVYVGVKAATPQAPTVTANQTDATLKVTPPTGVDEMRITYIPSGSETSKEIVIKKTETGWSGPSGNGITIGANGEVTFDHTVAKDGSEVKAKVKNGNSDYSAEGSATDPTKAATPQAPTVTANQTDAT
ncbi:YSIRK-type signal peptide-containing protein, partial [uncultured Streptococcus sp.]|uniref:YSIRK-type signal peptide-containing protein n=1 Tax=uncultured Streptococcus sp. TaxID=83427 RepID=UPI0028D1AC18